MKTHRSLPFEFSGLRAWTKFSVTPSFLFCPLMRQQTTFFVCKKIKQDSLHVYFRSLQAACNDACLVCTREKGGKTHQIPVPPLFFVTLKNCNNYLLTQFLFGPDTTIWLFLEIFQEIPEHFEKFSKCIKKCDISLGIVRIFV